jgi:myo-inositol-1(or 4)-monophosphatase
MMERNIGLGGYIMNWESIAAIAKQWVMEAGQTIRTSFEMKLDIQTKSNANDLVTNMDREVEQFFIKKVRETFPDHKILGEEGFGDNLENLDGVVWLLDPIDGTMNFVHQQRDFAISVGIFEDGVGKVGLIYDVVRDELYHAVRGNGAYLNEKKLSELPQVDIQKAIIGINPTWLMENRRIDHNLLIPLARDARGLRSYGSAALEMAFVAAGRIDAYVALRLAPWDFGGGSILVEEAGGSVTNLKGEKLDFLTKDTLLVAKPGLHEKILKKYLNDGNW